MLVPMVDVFSLSSRGDLMDTASLVLLLKAAAEPTRLRILLLLSQREYSVKDLTRVLGQSQPRISRHLKLLTEAGLIERVREGSWAYYHLAEGTAAGRLAQVLIEPIDPSIGVARRDWARAEALKRERVEAAQSFFRAHAARWDSIRALHLAEEQVETAMLDALGPGPFDLLVDMGTGTGRILDVCKGRYKRAIGIDASPAMLSYARARLDRLGWPVAQLRQGDICNLNLNDGVANAVVMHQVLHFLAEPALAISEAARILAPDGRLLVVDFAPHNLEILRDEFAHVRLGVAADQIAQWMAAADLKLVSALDLEPPSDTDGNKLTVSIYVGAPSPRERLISAAPAQTNTVATTGEFVG